MFRAGDRIGPYILISQIGRGGLGVVWLAEIRTTITTTNVAVKMPLDEDIELDAIRQEANLWVQASGHPNVLPIIEANIYDGQVVIVLHGRVGAVSVGEVPAGIHCAVAEADKLVKRFGVGRGQRP